MLIINRHLNNRVPSLQKIITPLNYIKLIKSIYAYLRIICQDLDFYLSFSKGKESKLHMWALIVNVSGMVYVPKREQRHPHHTPSTG